VLSLLNMRARARAHTHTHKRLKVFMFYHIILFIACLMTLISYMHIHHYVSVHVLPEDILA